MSSSGDDWLELAGGGEDDPTLERVLRVARSPSRLHIGPGDDPLGRVGKLAAAVAVFVLVVVTAATLAGGTDYRSSDRSYLARLEVPAADSAAIGRLFERTLSAGRLKSPSAVRSLESLLRRQRADESAIESIAPPPRLRAQQAAAVTSFQMRTDGLSGFVAGVRDPRVSAASLAPVGYRLVTSDILWQVSVQEAIAAELGREGVHGLVPPGSPFLSTPDAVFPEALSGALAAAPATTSGGSAAAGAALKPGSTGPAVSAWQVLLRAWLEKAGLPATVTVNGTFDAATEAATLRFQQNAGLTADGVVGPLTHAALLRAAGP